jgi:hypothetical protein
MTQSQQIRAVFSLFVAALIPLACAGTDKNGTAETTIGGANASSIGGASAKGGASAAGGTTGTGGTTAVGGTKVTGGTTSVDDTTAVGGTKVTGGTNSVGGASTATGCVEKPGPTNTGVPAGTSLTVVNGDIILDETWVKANGRALDGMDVAGSVYVRTNNLTIKNSRIRGYINQYYAGNEYGQILIQDCEIGPVTGGTSFNAGIQSGHDVTVRRCNIHNLVDGIFMGGANWTLEKNYIHHPYRAPADHSDCLQSEEVTGPGFLTVTCNNFDYSTGATGSSDGGDSAFMGNGVYTDQGHPAGTPSLDLSVTDNWFNGGNYTLQITNRWHSVIVENNKFGQAFRFGPITLGSGGTFGDENGAALAWSFSNNTWEDTGVVIAKP